MEPLSPQPVQSALHAAPQSASALLAELGNVLYLGSAFIFVFVMALALYGVYAKATEINVRRWVIGGGLAFPIVTLSVLLVYSLGIGNAVSSIGAPGGLQFSLRPSSAAGVSAMATRDDAVRVHVIGKQWWWEIRYEQPGSAEQIVLANEIRIPVGRPVELLLSSTDVIHSFWAPSLAGKVDMIPGRTTHLTLQTNEAGVHRAQCAEYCGGQHAMMALYVIAQSAEEFESWLQVQAQPANVPADPLLKLGYDAFFAGECQECHTIRGTPAAGDMGPDLTHVGGRVSLAAGVLDNHIGTMAGWIAGAQDIKPGNLMPSAAIYSGQELRALSAWLGSLE